MREKANDGKFVLAMIILGIMILLFGLTNVEEQLGGNGEVEIPME